MENISTYKNDNKVIQISTPPEFSGYTASLTVNTPLNISISGVTIVNNSATFQIEKSMNNVEAGVYLFDVRVENATNSYTIKKGSYTVLNKSIL